YNANTNDSFIGNINPFRYKSYYYDKESNLYYLNSRYYSPIYYRFISIDDIDYIKSESINGINLYTYCGNDPINYTDPSGHFAFFAACILIGLALGTGYGIYKDWQDNDSIDGSIGIGGYATWIGLGGLIGAGVGLLGSAALTGSFFSSVEAVKMGTYITYSMYILGGSASAGLMMADNIFNSFNYKTHIFWSGGELSMNGASYLASQTNGITLEMTRLGRYLTKIDASYATWQFASMNFVNQVPNGSIVFAVQNMSGVSLSSTWAMIEYPELIRKGVEIIFTILGWL
ncbi:MAG: RHS repeat-associated core domain-containing protein, partial [Candidatus Caccosoma sp.]|nr:RHS repeat-associated core domain-containing protein [Candidatus Caccosoma sp.]